jgi:hypothetical protein
MPTRDAFTRWLQQRDGADAATVYQPGAFLGAPPVGWQLTLGRTRFVYRVPDEAPDIFYIVRIERAEGRSGLHSPLYDMVRLLKLIKASDAPIRWIRGHVEPVKNRPADALPRERLIAFYQRYLTALNTGFENGVEWYGGDLTAFNWRDEKQKIATRRPRQQPPGTPQAGLHLNR